MTDKFVNEDGVSAIRDWVLSKTDNAFVATYGTTTYAEVKAAVDARKNIWLQHNTILYRPSVSTASYDIYFSYAYPDELCYFAVDVNSKWSTTYLYEPIAQERSNWAYKIYPDHTFEAWFKQGGYTITINNASGNLYRSPLTSLALPPDIYNNYTVDIRHATVNCAHNNYPAWGMVASYYATGVNFYAMSGGSRNSSPNYTLDAYVFGVLS